MAEFTLRQARPEDLEGLYQVFSIADTLHQQAHPEVYKQTDDPASVKEYLLSGILDPDAAVFVAQVQEQIAGAVIASVRQTREISILVQRTYLTVENLVVAEAFRQQGVGRALMENVHHWAQERDIQQVQLTVWDFNESAQEFYSKLGYQTLSHHMRKDLP